MKYEVDFVVNTSENVLVKSHQGKLKFNGEIKPLKGQRGVACTIASRERLRVFFGKAAEGSDSLEVRKARRAEQILKPLKITMSAPYLDYDILYTQSLQALVNLGDDPMEAILKNPYFLHLRNEDSKRRLTPLSLVQFLRIMPMQTKAQISYLTLLDKLDLYFDFKNVSWSIESGFEGLQQALRKNGQIIFQGKYGKCFHGLENTLKHPSESTSTRQVYFFKKNSLRPSSWTHCVIVDQAKLVDNTPYVFFRDPYDASIPGESDKVYMLSYKRFVERISDKYGNAATNTTSATYGISRNTK